MTKKDLISPKETLNFQFHPRIFSSLGADLVTNDVVALMELVKNAYDAMAKRVDIRFITGPLGEHVIEIQDNGDGMSRIIIENVWCVVATPYRRENPFSKDGKRKRRVSGEKGLGRLSAARLGDNLEVITKAEGESCWHYNVNWQQIASAKNPASCSIHIERYLEASPFTTTGTLLRISKLHGTWDEESIEKIKEQLSRFLSPFTELDDFSIWFTPPGKQAEPVQIKSPEFLSHPPYCIEGYVDEYGTMRFSYKYSAPRGDRTSAGQKKHFAVSEKGVVSPTDKPSKDKKILCGAFAFRIRAWDLSPDDILEVAGRYDTKKSAAEFRRDIKFHAGISLYRDGILVLPKSSASRDWIGLDLRRISRVGTRLATNQIIGYVAISADKNNHLKDTSDRERLVDDLASKQFSEFVTRIIETLELERDRDKISVAHKEPPFKDLFGALSARPLMSQVSKIAGEGGTANAVLPLVEAYSAHVDDTVVQIERRLIYYSRLASLGVISAMLVHEVRNQIGAFDRLLEILRQKGDNLLTTVEKNVKLAEGAVRALRRLANTFAPLASQAFGARRRDSILEEVIEHCLAMREKELQQLKLEPEWPHKTKHRVAVDPGELSAIFLNLIDNALYWMSTSTTRKHGLRFVITPMKDIPKIRVELHDSGPGVEAADEERIFWPGFTRKPEGIGMGLPVASEIVSQYGGKMYLAKPGALDGAAFGFDIPLIK